MERLDARDVDRRRATRQAFEFLVLEHRPEGEAHPQAVRPLRCTDFSIGGMRLQGQPRYQRFKITIAVPPDGGKMQTEVEVVHRVEDSFGVRFVSPSDELREKLSWWLPEPGRSADSGA